MIPLFLLISGNKLILCRDIHQVLFCAFMDRAEDEIHNRPLDRTKNSTMITILWNKASSTRHTECFPFTKKSGNFGWNVKMERLFWFVRPENFRNRRNVFRGSPKFPTGLSERKMCVPFALFY